MGSPSCRETTVSRTANVGTWLRKRNGRQKWVTENILFIIGVGIEAEFSIRDIIRKNLQDNRHKIHGITTTNLHKYEH